MTNKQFPKDFIFGTALASYQVEGGIYNNDWTIWENKNEVLILDKDGYHIEKIKKKRKQKKEFIKIRKIKLTYGIRNNNIQYHGLPTILSQISVV